MNLKLTIIADLLPNAQSRAGKAQPGPRQARHEPGIHLQNIVSFVVSQGTGSISRPPLQPARTSSLNLPVQVFSHGLLRWLEVRREQLFSFCAVKSAPGKGHTTQS